jgi:hypothetical protein
MTNGAEASPASRALAQFAGLAKDGARLARQTAELARQESKEKLTPAVRSIGMVAGGGALATLGGVYLLQSVVRLLSTRMPPWLASLLFGGALAAGGALLAGRGGRQLSNLHIVPEKTIKSLREDKEWVLHQIKYRLT